MYDDTVIGCKTAALLTGRRPLALAAAGLVLAFGLGAGAAPAAHAGFGLLALNVNLDGSSMLQRRRQA